MKRTLHLKRETLTELTAEDLHTVVGGADATGRGTTCPLLDCVGVRSLVPACPLTFNTC